MSDEPSNSWRIARWFAGVLLPTIGNRHFDPDDLSHRWQPNESELNHARSVVSVAVLACAVIAVGLWWLFEWMLHWIARMTV